MLRSVLAAAGAATLLVGAATSAFSQTPATPGTPQATGRSGANVGSLTCNVAGGMGFVFGSSKELSCLFNRANGTAERYTGTIKKFGVDIGFTKESQIIWLVTTIMPLLVVVSVIQKRQALGMALAVGALVVVASGVIYISFCLRCPRCSGWIVMPKCPACGLKLESGKSREQT